MISRVWKVGEEADVLTDIESIAVGDRIRITMGNVIPLDGIAAEFHLTPQYLAKLYSKKTGQFLMDYLREYRLEQAKKLLMKGDMSVSEVAMNTGFDNFSYFSTLFKKETGMSPQQYRASIMKTE